MGLPPNWPRPPGLFFPPPPSKHPGLADFSALAKLLNIPARRDLFVSYHHGGDQAFYNALARLCDDCNFLYDGSVDRKIDSEDAEYQERRIREEYMAGTSATIVLCGRQTFERKFVDWEICATLNKQHGLIGLRLPTAPISPIAGTVRVPDRFYDNWVSGYALWQTWGELATAQDAAAVLRGWIEAAIAREKKLIRNQREKKARNG